MKRCFVVFAFLLCPVVAVASVYSFTIGGSGSISFTAASNSLEIVLPVTSVQGFVCDNAHCSNLQFSLFSGNDAYAHLSLTTGPGVCFTTGCPWDYAGYLFPNFAMSIEGGADLNRNGIYGDLEDLPDGSILFQGSGSSIRFLGRNGSFYSYSNYPQTTPDIAEFTSPLGPQFGFGTFDGTREFYLQFEADQSASGFHGTYGTGKLVFTPEPDTMTLLLIPLVVPLYRGVRRKLFR